MSTEMGNGIDLDVSNNPNKSNLDSFLTKLQEKRLGKEMVVEDFVLEGVPPEVIDVCKEINKRGGRAMIVGGSVRDGIINREHPEMNLAPKDFDLEIFDMPIQALNTFLIDRYGQDAVSSVGVAFGTVKVKIPGFTEPLDFAQPRTESKKKGDSSHKGFDVTLDPHLSFLDAARRRDVTANAILYDPLEQKIYDPFGGIEDIRNKIIRATNYVTFAEDALRVLRIAQFISRFGFSVEDDTAKLCNILIANGELDISPPGEKGAKGLSKERIGEEFAKLFLKSQKPSLGFRFLKEIGYLQKYLPMIDSLSEMNDTNENGFEATMEAIDLKAKELKSKRDNGSLLTENDLNTIESAVKKVKDETYQEDRRRLLADLFWKIDEESMHDLMREARRKRATLMDQKNARKIRIAKESKQEFTPSKLLRLEAETRALFAREYWSEVTKSIESLKETLLGNGMLKEQESASIDEEAKRTSVEFSDRERMILTKNKIDEKGLVLMIKALSEKLGSEKATKEEMFNLFEKITQAVPVRNQVLASTEVKIAPPVSGRDVLKSLNISEKNVGAWLPVIIECIRLDRDDGLLNDPDEMTNKIREYHKRLTNLMASQPDVAGNKSKEREFYFKFKDSDPRILL